MNATCKKFTIRGWFLAFVIIRAVKAYDCFSETYNFELYHNASHKLDLSTEANQQVASFKVSDTKSAFSNNDYLAVNVLNDELIFTTTEAFEQYERTEQDPRIAMQIQFNCATGTVNGTYYQDLLEVNNHIPVFLQAVYEATVPLPLPKNFDLTQFFNDGQGIVAVDYDLVNNTVEFSLPDNQYLKVHSVEVVDNNKAFKAVLMFKEQVLKLPENIEVKLTGTDRGFPQKSGSATVLIKPDSKIVYNDPLAFKQTFIREEYQPETGNSIIVALMPETVHMEVEYALVGDDAKYFELHVEADKSKATVKLKNEPRPPRGKYFLNALVLAKRSELQIAQCAILIDLNESPYECVKNVTTVEKVLSTIHLEEEQEHAHIFPINVDNCIYEILHQTPNKSRTLFHINETSSWIESSKFDREDWELFGGMEQPQFQLILQLKCPASFQEEDTAVNSENLPVFANEIPYSADTTYLNVIVEDINDNAPIFTFPADAEVFAFPIGSIAEQLLPLNLLQVVAYDLDAGLNAIIRFSVAPNDHFDIDSTTGVIYPLKNALADENPIELEIRATDRDGAESGNTATIKIRVLPASLYQLTVLQLDGVKQHQLDDYIQKLQMESGLRIAVLASGYTPIASDEDRERTEETNLKAIVVAFKKDGNLMSTDRLVSALPTGGELAIVSLERHLNFEHSSSEDCRIYPYVVVMAVFIVLFIATCALAAYFWSKQRGSESVHLQNRRDASGRSDDVLVENPHHSSQSTPPASKKTIQGAINDYSTDSISRRNRMVRTLSDLLIVEEESSKDDHREETLAEHKPQKSIRFNEDVKRIEVFERV